MSFQSLPNVSSRQLQAIVALAENRSFIATAAFMKISQPALTRIVQQVESLLGVELFSRTTRQVATTAAGKEFVALAERLLSDFKLGLGSLHARLGEARGQVVVASVLLFSEPRLPKVIADYRKEYSRIDLQFREGVLGTVLDDVRAGVADFGIAYVDALPETFVVETLGIEYLHVALPSDHLLARKPKITIEDLKEHALISYPPDSRTRRLSDAMAASAGISLRHAVTVNRISTLMSLVRNGIGIAIVPSSERPTKNEGSVTSRPLFEAKLSRLGIVRLRDRELSPAAAHFLSVLKGWIRQVAPRKLRAAQR